MNNCTHQSEIRMVSSDKTACEDCAKTGESWVHLRMCLTCGYVGCCDSSKSKHARAHFNSTAHMLIRSVEPGEEWGYCYVDDVYIQVK